MAFYDFSAAQLAQQRANPQLKNMGIIEFDIDGLVPGGKEALLLGLSSFALPEVRRVQPIEINYLNGTIKYPGSPSAIGDLSATFNDFVTGQQRAVLHQWFDYVYDESSGLSALASAAKVDSHVILYANDGFERAEYLLEGVWPTSDPPLPSIDYGDRTSHVQMEMTFSVDFVHVVSLGGVNFGISAGSLFNVAGAANKLGASLGFGGVSVNTRIGAGGFGGSVSTSFGI